jgi:hypothetical protein
VGVLHMWLLAGTNSGVGSALWCQCKPSLREHCNSDLLLCLRPGCLHTAASDLCVLTPSHTAMLAPALSPPPLQATSATMGPLWQVLTRMQGL